MIAGTVSWKHREKSGMLRILHCGKCSAGTHHALEKSVGEGFPAGTSRLCNGNKILGTPFRTFMVVEMDLLFPHIE